MSVLVELEGLAAEVGRFGPAAYLLTVSDDGRPHAVGVHVELDGGSFLLTAGQTTARNAAARPEVTLLFAPFEPGGYSLIVDGTASVAGDAVTVAVASAVLHRTRQSDGDDGHGRSDCVGVFRH